VGDVRVGAEVNSSPARTRLPAECIGVLRRRRKAGVRAVGSRWAMALEGILHGVHGLAGAAAGHFRGIRRVPRAS